MPDTEGLVLHVVRSGLGTVELPGGHVSVPAGHVLLLSSGGPHRVVSADTGSETAERLRASRAGSVTLAHTVPDEGAPTFSMLTVVYAVPAGPPSPLSVPHGAEPVPTQLDPVASALLVVLAALVERQGSGDRVAASRVAEALLAAVIHLSFDRQPSRELTALRDPRLARAVAMSHSDLAHPWSVDELARLSGMSESLFRSRFRSAVGEP